MKLVGIPAEYFDAAAPFLRRFLEDFAARSGGRYSADAYETLIRDRAIQCWVAMNEAGDAQACALTEIVVYPTGARWARMIAGGGDERQEWQDLMMDLIESAKAEGFAGFEAFARPGWARVFRDSMRETHRILEMEF